MSYLRISTVSISVTLADLGYVVTHPATNFMISDQFSVQDLENSNDLTAAIQGGSLTAEVNLDGTWSAVAAGDWDPKDVFSAFGNIYEIANTVDNEDLVNGNDVEASGPGGNPLHIHDGRYFTETELGSTSTTSGGTYIGIDDSSFTNISGDDVQEVFESVDNFISSGVDLDLVYDNDADGIMDVDGSTKDLNLRSDNANDVVISRTNTTNDQDALRLDVSAAELLLGAAVQGALAQLNVRVKTNLIVDGDIQWTGTLTDTTVNEMNVTNANILMRDGATNDGDAALLVERGGDGADASLNWNSTTDRWEAGVIGTTYTIPGLERDEDVSGVWTFEGEATEPNLILKENTTAPTTNLGAAGEIPINMFGDGILAVYDKSNSRNKWLSVHRETIRFNGRDNANNTNEYARLATFTSNQTGDRLLRNATLVGIVAQTKGSETWTVRVRKNGSATNLASLPISAAAGGGDSTLNIDFNAGDQVQAYIEGTSIDRPMIKLEIAYRF